MKVAVVTLSVALLLVSAGWCTDEDYSYDEQAEEEFVDDFVPKFISSPQTVKVALGHNATLPCYVDKLPAAMLILWTSRDMVYFIGSRRQRDLPVTRLVSEGDRGNSLFLENVQLSEAGTYQCQIGSQPPITLTHTVLVKYAPSVTTDPASGTVTAVEGSSVQLSCLAEGYPEPVVTWTKIRGLLANGEKKETGSVLTLPAVHRSDAGRYMCRAENGMDPAATGQVTLQVNYAAKTQPLQRRVHSGPDLSAQLACQVHGQPTPQVSWSRLDGVPVSAKSRQEHKDKNVYTLTLAQLQDADMGVYICRAANELGTSEAQIDLTGLPESVEIVSAAHGSDGDKYVLTWRVNTSAPIDKFIVRYRPAHSKSGQGGSAGPWTNITVMAEAGGHSSLAEVAGNSQRQYSYTIRGLHSNSVYEVDVMAANSFGWSESVDQTGGGFRFFTQGAQALGSVGMSSDASARHLMPPGHTMALFCAALLTALLTGLTDC